MDQIILTEPQQRSLRAALISYERALRLANRLLEDGDEVGILYHRKLSLDPDQYRLTHEKISRALQELSDLVKQLGLKPVEEDAARIIVSQMSASWTDLVDCRSDRMKGYGKVDLETATKIDPAIDGLAKIALELCNLITSDSSK
jgi:hypothetical protein